MWYCFTEPTLCLSVCLYSSTHLSGLSAYQFTNPYMQTHTHTNIHVTGEWGIHRSSINRTGYPLLATTVLADILADTLLTLTILSLGDMAPMLKLIIQNRRLGTRCEIAFRIPGTRCEIAFRIPQKIAYEKATLVEVMVWCRQATSHYPRQCWAILCHDNEFKLDMLSALVFCFFVD